MQPIDMVGQRFGKLEVVRFAGKNKFGQRLWECLCDCGSITIAPGSSIRYGATKSCGCGKYSYQLGEKSKTHGMSKTRTYSIFHGMHRRCSRPNERAYPSYGGRGIRVCDRWSGPGGFENFITDMGERPTGLSLERIDNNGNYEPENCKWASTEEQNNNRRSSKLITWNGQTKTMTAWATMLGHNSSWLGRRISKHGLEKAMQPFEKLGHLVCPHCGEAYLSNREERHENMEASRDARRLEPFTLPRAG